MIASGVALMDFKTGKTLYNAKTSDRSNFLLLIVALISYLDAAMSIASFEKESKSIITGEESRRKKVFGDPINCFEANL